MWWINSSGVLQLYARIEVGETYIQPTFTEHNWLLRDEDGWYLHIIEGAANQTVNWGAGGLADTLLGGDGNDTLFGMYGADYIDGGTGDDVVYAGSGDDTIRMGDTGADSVFGGSGYDILDLSGATAAGISVTWNDIEEVYAADVAMSWNWIFDEVLFHGGIAGDTAIAGVANDTIQGNDGADSLVGGGGADSILGGSGNDTIRGDSETDTVTTVYNGQSVTGTNNPDVYEWWGGTGESSQIRLDDGTGTIYSSDGKADAIFVVNTGDGATLTVQALDVFRDTIFVPEQWADYTVTYVANGHHTVTLTYASGNVQTFELYHNDDNDIYFHELFAVGQPPKTLGNDDTLSGGDGADLIYGEEGADLLDGGLGDDTIYFGAGNDTVLGGDGNDIIDDVDGFTLAGANAIEGGAGNDQIWAGQGADTIRGGLGDDTISGEEDADLIILEDGFGADWLTGGELGIDRDTLDFSALSVGVTGTFSGDEAGTFGDGTSTLTFLQSEVFVLTDLADSVAGGASSAAMEIYAGAGNDTIIGGSGSDTIAGGDGDDYIEGGAGDDLLSTGLGQDTLIGGDGNDTLMNSAGDDSLVGGAGDDSLVATDGNDTLQGGTGNDTMDGGNDADLFIIEDSFGADSILGGEGTSGAGPDYDTVDFSALTTAITVDYYGNEFGTATDGIDTLSYAEIERFVLTDQDDFLTGGADSVGIDADGGLGNDTLWGGVGDDTFAGGEGIDEIYGDDGADLIYGGAGGDDLGGDAGNDTLFGQDGDDYVQGMLGDDSVSGGAGADTVLGGAGSDTLSGGTGNDRLTGGTGNDTFIYAPGDGIDTITDFNAGNTGTLSDGDSTNNDFIDLSGYYDDIWELYADEADDGVLNQSNQGVDGVDYSDNTQFAGGGIKFTGASATPSFYTIENTGVVCFATGTLIATPTGEVPIESLCQGDLVLTRDNGPQPLVWLGRRRLGRRTLRINPNLRPVVIRPDLIGAHSPLVVSPQHGLLMRIDGDERLVRATHLAGTQGGQARFAKGCRSVTYMHLMFEAHQIVFANGAPSESFYPGPMAIGALATEPRQELAQLFPGLLSQSVRDAYGAPSRLLAPRCALPPRLRDIARVAH